MKPAVTRPSQTDCPAAPRQMLSTSKHTKQTNRSPNKDQQTNKNKQTKRLTVDDDNLHHGNGEERKRLQRNFDKDSGDDEDEHDDE